MKCWKLIGTSQVFIKAITYDWDYYILFLNQEYKANKNVNHYFPNHYLVSFVYINVSLYFLAVLKEVWVPAGAAAMSPLVTSSQSTGPYWINPKGKSRGRANFRVRIHYSYSPRSACCDGIPRVHRYPKALSSSFLPACCTLFAAGNWRVGAWTMGSHQGERDNFKRISWGYFGVHIKSTLLSLPFLLGILTNVCSFNVNG